MTMSLDCNLFALSRRDVLRGAAAVGAGLLLPMTSRLSVVAEGEQLIFLTWGGDFATGVRVAFSDPFQEQTGAIIQDVTPFSYGKFQTAMRRMAILRATTSCGLMTTRSRSVPVRLDCSRSSTMT